MRVAVLLYALHPRLGASSPLALLGPHLIQDLCELLLSDLRTSESVASQLTMLVDETDNSDVFEM